MRRWVLVGCAILGSGCDVGPAMSSDADTQDLALRATIESNGSIVQAKVGVQASAGWSVTLDGVDRLFLDAGGAETPCVLTGGDYVGQLATTATEVAVILDRGAGARFESTFTLPPPFVLVAPAAPVSRSLPITFTWDADRGAYEVRIEARSDCFPTIRRTLTVDDGHDTIQPADLPSATADACDVTVEVSRWWHSGTPAPGLAPGDPTSRWAAQIRTIVFSTTP